MLIPKWVIAATAPMPGHCSGPGLAIPYRAWPACQDVDTHASPYTAIPSGNQLSVTIYKCGPAEQTKEHFILGVLIAEMWRELCKLLRKH